MTGDLGGPGDRQRVVLVTGPSGAGRTTAIRALEDMGFEAIDNLPLSLLPRLLGPGTAGRPLAVGVDVRTRGFSAGAMVEALDLLSDRPGVEGTLLYLDCAEGTLIRRFSETRRRHPLAQTASPDVGLRQELDLLAPVRARADILIDTSDLTPHDLKAELGRWFSAGEAGGLTVSVESFSFKRGAPRSLDMMFDVRFLRNPYWLPALRPLTGTDRAVAEHVGADPRFAEFFGRLVPLLLHLLPAFKDEGKAYLSIGFGCTGGQHRSVFVAEAAAERLEAAGWSVSIRHRELERLGGGGAAR